MSVKLYVNELDGKKVAYSSETHFYVDVGKGPKGSYKNRHHNMGSLVQAVTVFNSINIGNGHKKRLRMENEVLARKFSD
jgi:hypothetical protein